MSRMRETDPRLLEWPDCVQDEVLAINRASVVSPRTAAFKYSPLKTSGSEIRLFLLHPGEVNDKIEGSIVHADRSKLPAYEALSYRWGEALPHHLGSEPLESIIVDEMPLTVRGNLSSGLRRLRLRTQVRILWVDAICIDQSDMIERRHQVNQMGHIYRSALRVVIWLDDVDSLVDPGLGVAEYWTRLWIIQEILMASEVVVQCRGCTATWEELLHHLREHDMIQCDALTHIIRHRGSRLRKSGFKALPLTELVVAYKQARCSDFRDRIFGLLGLTKQCCQDAVTVSYMTSMYQLYTAVIFHCLDTHLQEHGCIDSILQTCHEVRDALDAGADLQAVVPRGPVPGGTIRSLRGSNKLFTKCDHIVCLSKVIEYDLMDDMLCDSDISQTVAGNDIDLLACTIQDCREYLSHFRAILLSYARYNCSCGILIFFTPAVRSTTIRFRAFRSEAGRYGLVPAGTKNHAVLGPATASWPFADRYTLLQPHYPNGTDADQYLMYATSPNLTGVQELGSLFTLDRQNQLPDYKTSAGLVYLAKPHLDLLTDWMQSSLECIVHERLHGGLKLYVPSIVVSKPSIELLVAPADTTLLEEIRVGEDSSFLSTPIISP